MCVCAYGYAHESVGFQLVEAKVLLVEAEVQLVHIQGMPASSNTCYSLTGFYYTCYSFIFNCFCDRLHDIVYTCHCISLFSFHFLFCDRFHDIVYACHYICLFSFHFLNVTLTHKRLYTQHTHIHTHTHTPSRAHTHTNEHMAYTYSSRIKHSHDESLHVCSNLLSLLSLFSHRWWRQALQTRQTKERLTVRVQRGVTLKGGGGGGVQKERQFL